jgi:uncharacterized protein (DUF169 family)
MEASKMPINNQKLSVLDKLNLKIQPVGIQFCINKPEGIERLNKKSALCEMLKYAQEGNVFFTDTDNHTCGGGKHVVGGEVEKFYTNGQFGAGLQVFNNTNAASTIYTHIPKLSSDVAKYITFAPLNKLSFQADVLIILANTNQTEILLRAVSYKTGEAWESKSSVVISCAWMLAYPYLTGKFNYFSTGLGHGTRRKKLFPEGMHIVSIPAVILSSLLQTLQEMPWELPAFKPDGDEFVQKLLNSLSTGSN